MMHRRIVAISVCCLLTVFSIAAAYGQMHTSRNVQSKSQGAALFSQNCSACHGTDGRGGERAPNIASQREIVSLSDAQLNGIVSKGVIAAGMPGFAYLGRDNVKALVAYLRVLQGVSNTAEAVLPGNPRAGEAIFFGSGSCSNCHMVHGRGGFMGEDLTGYARGRTIASIRSAIIHPDNRNGSGNSVDIRTSDGGAYNGLVRAQDNFNIILQSEDGSFHSIPRNTIQKITDSGHSIMPQDYGTTLTAEQMNDLVSFLMEGARSADSALRVANRSK